MNRQLLNNGILVFFLLISTTLSVFGQTDEFDMANKFYEDKDFDSAIRMYESILSRGQESAPIYFNIGNAYFKKGDLGNAILNYMKAKRLDPSDEDIIHNLDFARQFSRVQMEGVELNPINSFLSSIVGSYRLNTLAWFSSIIFILFLVSLMIRFGMGISNSLVRISITLSLILLILSSGLTTFKYRSEYLTRKAVIIAEDSRVYTGASEQSDIELDAAPGLIVEIKDESGEFYNVIFENKRRGWIKKDLIAEI